MPRARKNNVVKMSKPESGMPRSAPQSAVQSDEIARRAYEIFQRRGGTHGADLDDWLQAERQLRGEAAAERRA
jgi:hypothetical protein